MPGGHPTLPSDWSGDGFRGRLTGSLATEAQLRLNGGPIGRHVLNDLGLVVDSFNAIPASLADRFLIHHIHPHAPEGKTLLQFVDKESALRVDFFRAFGTTLTRANVGDEGAALPSEGPSRPGALLRRRQEAVPAESPFVWNG
jgi:hypothetical protein